MHVVFSIKINHNYHQVVTYILFHIKIVFLFFTSLKIRKAEGYKFHWETLMTSEK